MPRAWVLSLVVAVISLNVGLASVARSQPEGVGDKIVRPADDSEIIQFALTLPLRDQAALDQEIKGMYDPKSPNFHHFLSVSEFENKYAPTAADYSSIKSFATASGLSIVGEPPGRTSIDVSANVATIRRVFRTQMHWRQRNDGKQYLWADNEPVPPRALALMGGNAAVLRQMPPESLIQHRKPGPLATNLGTGPSGTYVPNDIKTAYDLTTIQNGGTPVALYELSSAAYADAGVYATQFGLNNPTLIQKTVDGGTSNTAGAEEVMLDIEMVMAVSNSTSMYIYTGGTSSTAPLDTYKQIANDNLVGQVSSSWYTGCENDVGASTMNAENAVFTQMIAQGIAVFVALGDFGANNVGSANCVTGTGIGPQLLDPGSQPNITSAGGTSLTTSSLQAYVSEAVWNDTNGTGTGGGVSAYWPIPSYQAGLSTADTQFSAVKRNAPDMSLDADPATGYYIYCSTCGGWQVGVGGTSAVAPQLAAFWSLISKGLGGRAGFANPTLYELAQSEVAFHSNFHDVTVGNNGFYNAFAGYDNATGWGSYKGGNLYSAVLARRRATSLTPIFDLLLQ